MLTGSALPIEIAHCAFYYFFNHFQSLCYSFEAQLDTDKMAILRFRSIVLSHATYRHGLDTSIELYQGFKRFSDHITLSVKHFLRFRVCFIRCLKSMTSFFPSVWSIGYHPSLICCSGMPISWLKQDQTVLLLTQYINFSLAYTRY